MFIKLARQMSPGDNAGGEPGGAPVGEPTGAPTGDLGNEDPTNPGQGADPSNGGDSFDTLPAFAQKMVKDLRKENASYRTKAKALEERMGTIESGLKSIFGGEEGNEIPPEQQLGMAQQQLEAFATQNQILGLAIEHGIPKEGVKYFNYLLNDRIESLEEGEEIGEEDIAALAQEARAKSGGIPGGNTTSVQPNSAPKQGSQSGEVSLEQFGRMTIEERTQLFRKNPNRYHSLMAEMKSNYRRRG